MINDKVDSIKKYLSSKKDILCAYLFGSFAAGRVTKYSDIDIAVLFDDSVPESEFTDRQIQLINELSKVLDTEVDVIIMNKAPSFLKFQVLREGKRIFEKEGRTDHTFEARSIVEYLDFKPVRDRMESAIIRKIKER